MRLDTNTITRNLPTYHSYYAEATSLAIAISIQLRRRERYTSYMKTFSTERCKRIWKYTLDLHSETTYFSNTSTTTYCPHVTHF